MFARSRDHDWSTCEATASERRAKKKGLERCTPLTSAIMSSAKLAKAYRSGIPWRKSERARQQIWAEPWALQIAEHLLGLDSDWEKVVPVLEACKQDPTERARELALCSLHRR